MCLMYLNLNSFCSVNMTFNLLRLGEVNGKLLAEMVIIQIRSPDAFYPMVRQDLGMSMVDILKLNAALRELSQ